MVVDRAEIELASKEKDDGTDSGEVAVAARLALFGESFGAPELTAFREQILAWLQSDPGRIALAEAERLGHLLPSAIQHIAFGGPYLKEHFFGSLYEFAVEISERWDKYDEKVRSFGGEGDHEKAARWQRMRNRFLEQFLVNQLSRRGLIPTYSFPVHSLTLEVIRGHGRARFAESDIELSRDASLGISEYSPGAEAVANGRIWTSEGLAYYPRQFMPDRWYIACQECFHVDVADTWDELPTTCSNCGSAEGRRRRQFIEPHGFLTSYGNRRGRDPGSSRRRVRPADEARLIASPTDSHFEDTGVESVRTALLRASGDGSDELRGTMFIANRGGYGEGYLRCAVCGYATARKPARSGANPARQGRGRARRAVVDCPSDCANGCRQCLCDYSNQRFWDAFERRETLAWVRAHFGSGRKDSASDGFAPWASPSLAALDERLAGTSEVNLLARALMGSAATDSESLNLVPRWLQAGKRVNVYLADQPHRKPKEASVLEVYRFLHPYVVRGDLSIRKLSEDESRQWLALPRIFAEPRVGAPMFKQAFPQQALLVGLLSGTVQQGVIDAAWSDRLQGVLSSSALIPKDALAEGERLELFDLPACRHAPPGERRLLRDYRKTRE